MGTALTIVMERPAWEEMMAQAPWSFLMFLLAAVMAYLLGCSNGAVIISKYILHDDVRTHGSGNAGLTNFFRTFGGVWTFGVILIDVLKAVLAVLFAQWVIGPMVFAKYWAASFCLLGHMFPVMFGFKGGKGILSGGTLCLLIDWRIALVAWGGFLLFALLTKYVSLGSCWSAFSFPISSWLIFHDRYILAVAVFNSALVLWMHRANIKRLLSGTENKFHLHKKRQ